MKQYKSTLAALIQETVDNCITSGESVTSRNGLTITAEWDANEKDINVYIDMCGDTISWEEKDVLSAIL
jgi:hypothetical protein